MMVGALRLPVVIDGMIDESTTRRPSMPITRVSGSTTAIGSSRRAHLAGAGRVVGALDLAAHELIDLFVALHVLTRLNLSAAITIEGPLAENLARQPHAGPHFYQSSDGSDS